MNTRRDALKLMAAGVGFMVGGFTELPRAESSGNVATFTHFAHDIHVCPGDILKINMIDGPDKSNPECRVYHVENTCCVMGISKQGRPVIQDTRREAGYRLSTSKELVPDGGEVQPRPTPREYSSAFNGMC